MLRPVHRMGSDHEPHRRPVDMVRMSPPFVGIDRVGHEYEGNSRIREVRDDSDGAFFSNRRLMPGHDKVEWDFDYGNHQNHPQIMLRDLGLNLGRDEFFRELMLPAEEITRNGRGDLVDENARHGHSMRDVYNSPIELRGREFNHGDGSLDFYDKAKNRVSELGRCGDWDRMVENQELNRTPRKKLQKKNDFLRMQPGKISFRNRIVPNFSISKGNEPQEFTDQRTSKKREGSPVELDVSFKSNALVAKAIKAPLGSVVVCNEKSTSKDMEAKDLISEVCASMPQLPLVNDSCPKVDRGKHCGIDSSIRMKEEKQTEKEVRASNCSKEIAYLGSGNMHGSNSEACSSKTNSFCTGSASRVSLKETTSDKNDTDADFLKAPSRIVGKNEKVSLCLSSSKLMKKDSEFVNMNTLVKGSSAGSMSDKCLKRRGKVLSSASHVTGTVQNRLIAVPVKDNVNRPPNVIVRDEVDDSASGRSSISNTKRERNRIKPLPASSRQRGATIDESPVNADRSVDDPQPISNSDGVIESRNKSSSDIATENDISNCPDIVPVLVHNICLDGSPGDVIPGGVSGCSAFSSSATSTIPEVLMVASSPITGINTSLTPNNVLPNNIGLTVLDTTDVSTVPHENKASLSFDIDMIEDSSLAKFPDKGSENHANTDASCIRTGVALCSDALITIDSEELTTGSDTNTLEIIDRQPHVTVFSDVAAAVGSPNASDSTVLDSNFTSGKDYVSKNDKKRKLGAELELSGSRFDDPYMGSIHDSDITLTCSVSASDPVKVEEKIASSLSCLDGKPNLLLGNGINDNCLDDTAPVSSNVNSDSVVFSPACKKRKGLSSQSGFLSASSELCEIHVSSDAFVCNAEEPAQSIKTLPHLEEEVQMPSVDYVNSDLALFSVCSTVLPDKSVPCGTSDILHSVRDDFGDESSKPELPGSDSCPTVNQPALPYEHSPILECRLNHKEGKSSSIGAANVGNETIDVETESGTVMHAENPADDCGVKCRLNDQHCPFELQTKDFDDGLLPTDLENHNNISSMVDVPSASKCLMLSAEPIHTDGVARNMLDTYSIMFFQESLCAASPNPHMSSAVVLPHSGVSDEKLFVSGRKSNEKTLVEGADPLSSFPDSFAQTSEVNLKSDTVAAGDQHSVKTVSFPSQAVKKTQPGSNTVSRGLNKRKNQLSYFGPKVLPGQSSFVTTTSDKTTTTQILKSRTWHRTEKPPTSSPTLKSVSLTAAALKNPSYRRSTKFGNTYIRTGNNSIVRNPASSAVQDPHVLNASGHLSKSSGNYDAKLTNVSEGRIDLDDASSCLVAGGQNAPFEIPRTPPLPYSNNAVSFEDYKSSPMADPSVIAENEEAFKSSDDALKSSRKPEIDSDKNMEVDCVSNDGHLSSSNAERMVYVKPKLNQLVSASESSKHSVHSMDRAPDLSSDGYYKKSRNQLVRASSKSHIQQTVAIGDDSSNSEGYRALKCYSGRSFVKEASSKVNSKSTKPPKISLVWTLSNTQLANKGIHLSRNKGIYSSRWQKVLPNLLPWKRATYWRSSLQSVDLSNGNSLSTFSRKLLSSRKRNIIYTRSGRGFSLRRSKVVGVAGRSLKWSKSIERRSKKANKEAKLAVAAMEGRKREQNSMGGVPVAKMRSHSSRKRIFRIGSFRYRMDSSGRTLLRIPDEDPSTSAIEQQENNNRKPYVPKRLMIGNDEYVRIGNGNQLIRDPKRRKRILASEKVRWSLHTARMRFAKKQKYCQFFTRFGKCNKDEGKCPYIHDSSKIAVCTKFLNGLCSDANCKLTHEVIPERMPDCSFFLQGLCSNESCPYRHVNVNPKASICGNFLRGYCADGNECRKKHSYICPIFEATGSCPEESKCKLYHPRKVKDKNRKYLEDQKNYRGRYFGPKLVVVAEAEPLTSGKLVIQKNGDRFIQEGRYADYISLDVSDYEVEEEDIDDTSEQLSLYESDTLGSQLHDSNALIKPVRLLDKNLSPEFSPAASIRSWEPTHKVMEESANPL
ncbi:hypothetical protein Nepgr_018992 [Nepenthes gracilis]|uniref:C3H1-type domain-containing protein n=1 Tax=Nepenthes gracilis TaxID=150966 RepID=A0AAD3SW46_NEPGR|nr:hypothetical protein Nepgr_018992 [Nepenthes gracilis]